MTTIHLPDALSRLAFAVIDVEGNGRQPAEIVEVAVLPTSGTTPVAPGQVRSWLVRPRLPITHMVTAKAHGITNADVAHSPPWDHVAPQVIAAVKGRILVAHNASVERRVLAEHAPDLRPSMIIDTLRLARSVWPGLDGGYGLDRLIDHVGITAPEAVAGARGWRRHRAANDTWATAALFAHLATGREWPEIRDAARIPVTSGNHVARPGPLPQGLW